MTKFQAISALIFLSLFGALSANSQEVIYGPSASMDADIPNAPSATQAGACTQNNGKPCPELLQKIIGPYPPNSQTKERPRDLPPASLWKYRGPNDPPLRTNKQVFHSKLFVVTHVGGAIAMVMACRTKGSGYGCGSQSAVVGSIFGLDYIQFRYIGGPNAIGPPIYEMVHYSLASTK